MMHGSTLRMPLFTLVLAGVGLLIYLIGKLIAIEYLFFAGYTVLQFVVLATAWNILGGYCGYVNFGSAAFFAMGAYTSVALHKLAASIDKFFDQGIIASVLHAVLPLPIPLMIVFGGVISGLVGLGTGYLTLRLRGAFFAIATLALAVVLQTLIINWDFVGGSRGAYIIRPQSVPLIGSYIEYLFVIMLALTVLALCVARAIERSQLGFGFATIRDDEVAAEASGVPTLRLKLIATTLSGALMGMAGAPFPYYIGYLEPASAFGLAYAVNSIAMPMIGGTTSWLGPLVGALLLGTLQQVASVTIQSAVNLLIVGVLLVVFVIIAPNGLVGLMQEFLRATAPDRLTRRSLALVLIAGYAIVAGMFGVVLALSTIMAGGTAVGVFAFVVAVLLIASAYGLLKLENWAPMLATASFALSIPMALIDLWGAQSVAFALVNGAAIIIALAAIAFLQTGSAKSLYQPLLRERGATS
jgi:branched-chain amino acid transport system permease protein